MSVFFVHSGSLKLQLTDNPLMIDAYGFDALKLLLQKEIVHGDTYTRGHHFGELCFLSKMGLRPDSVRAVTKSELYFLNKEDTWKMFRYLLAPDRRKFLHHLMTRVGDKQHTHHELVEDDDKHSRNLVNEYSLRHFYRMAHSIFKQILTSPDLSHINDAVHTAPYEESGPALLQPPLNAEELAGPPALVQQRHSILRTLHSEFQHRHSNIADGTLNKDGTAATKHHHHHHHHHRRVSSSGSHHHHTLPSPNPGSPTHEGRGVKHGYSFDESDPLHSEAPSSPEASVDGSRRNSLSEAAGSRRNTLSGMDLQSLHQGSSVGDEDQDDDDEDEDDDDDFQAPIRSSIPDSSLALDSSKFHHGSHRDGGRRRQSLFLAAATMMAAENLHNSNTNKNNNSAAQNQATAAQSTLPDTLTQSPQEESSAAAAAAAAAAVKPRSRKNSSVRFEDDAVQDILTQRKTESESGVDDSSHVLQLQALQRDTDH